MFTAIANSVNSLAYTTAGFALKAAVVIPLVVYVIGSAYERISNRYSNQLKEARFTISIQEKQLKDLSFKQKELEEKFSKMLLANNHMASALKDHNLVIQEHQQLHANTANTINKNHKHMEAMCDQLRKDIYIVEKCAMEETENLKQDMDDVYRNLDRLTEMSHNTKDQMDELYEYADTTKADLSTRLDETNNSLTVLENNLQTTTKDIQYQITEIYEYTDMTTANIHTRINETNHTVTVLENNLQTTTSDIEHEINEVYEHVDDSTSNLHTRIDETNASMEALENIASIAKKSDKTHLNKVHTDLAEIFSRTDKFEEWVLQYINDKNETTMNYVDAKVKSIKEDLITFYTSTEHKFNNMNEVFADCAYTAEDTSLRLEDLNTRFSNLEISTLSSE